MVHASKKNIFKNWRYEIKQKDYIICKSVPRRTWMYTHIEWRINGRFECTLLLNGDWIKVFESSRIQVSDVRRRLTKCTCELGKKKCWSTEKKNKYAINVDLSEVKKVTIGEFDNFVNKNLNIINKSLLLTSELVYLIMHILILSRKRHSLC